MDYKNLKIYHYTHLSKINKFALLKETGIEYGGYAQFRIAVKVKNNIDRCKKSFYKLFDEHTRRELISLDKRVTKTYSRIISKTPFILENRNVIKIGIDHDDHMVKPQYDAKRTYRGIYRFVREKGEFIPDTRSNDNTERVNRENEITNKHGKEMQELARVLYLQEEFVKMAIETSLRDQKLKDIAIESALYIGHINGYELAGAKKLIR